MILGTSDSWSTSHLSQRTCILNCRLSDLYSSQLIKLTDNCTPRIEISSATKWGSVMILSTVPFVTVCTEKNICDSAQCAGLSTFCSSSFWIFFCQFDWLVCLAKWYEICLKHKNRMGKYYYWVGWPPSWPPSWPPIWHLCSLPCWPPSWPPGWPPGWPRSWPPSWPPSWSPCYLLQTSRMTSHLTARMTSRTTFQMTTQMTTAPRWPPRWLPRWFPGCPPGQPHEQSTYWVTSWTTFW